MSTDTSEAAPNAFARALLNVPCLLLGAALVNFCALPGTSGDLRKFVVPWYHYILEHGRFASLADGFANYTPPYLYLLSLGSFADGLVPPVLVVKLVSIAGSLALALCAYRLLTALLPRRTARLAACGLLLLPTVWINSAWWGQCDAIHAAASVLAVAQLMRGRWWSGMAALGLAMSFKFQAVFLAPLILYLLVSRRLPVASLLVPPLVYMLMMLPAWLAGRSAWDLATVYMMQAGYYFDLSASAPNIWEYIDGLHLVSYQHGVIIGTALGIAATIALTWIAWRRHLDGENLLPLAVGATIALPYLLPKMHNRYFFLADVLSYAMAVSRPSPRRVRIAVMVQIGSTLASLRYLIKIPAGAPIGGIFMTAALVLIMREILAMPRRSPRDDNIAPRLSA